jgi:hypothetical protein
MGSKPASTLALLFARPRLGYQAVVVACNVDLPWYGGESIEDFASQRELRGEDLTCDTKPSVLEAVLMLAYWLKSYRHGSLALRWARRMQERTLFVPPFY